MSSDAAFDADRLREVFGESEEELVAFLRFALDSMRQVVDRLTVAAARRDGEAGERLAHELKGASANAGARALAAIGERVEGAVRSHSWVYVDQLIEDAGMALAEAAAYVTTRARGGH